MQDMAVGSSREEKAHCFLNSKYVTLVHRMALATLNTSHFLDLIKP